MELHADTAQFQRMGAQLGRLAPEIRKQLRRSLADVARPVGQFVAVSAGRQLPRRGGLGYDIAGAKPVVSVTGQQVSIRFNVKQKWYLARIDQGQLRHPVFGRVDASGKRVMVEQKVTPGAFRRPFDQSASRVRTEVLTAMQTTLRNLG